MKYVKEIIELMAVHPDREWRMSELIRYVCPSPKSQMLRSAVHVAVWRAVKELEAAGAVIAQRRRTNGGYATYRWR